MQKAFLKICLILLGSGAVAIGLSMMIFGPEITGNIFAGIISQLSSHSGKLNDFSSPNVDSELRFYAVFWIAYGVVLVLNSKNPGKNNRLVPLLLGLFFIGGVGRVLSYVLVGEPHALFVILMGIELILPPVLLVFWTNTDA